MHEGTACLALFIADDLGSPSESYRRAEPGAHAATVNCHYNNKDCLSWLSFDASLNSIGYHVLLLCCVGIMVPRGWGQSTVVQVYNYPHGTLVKFYLYFHQTSRHPIN